MRLFKFAENAHFDFVGQRWVAFAVTLIMTFGSIGLFFTHGLNYGIDFTGGVMMQVETPKAPDLPKMRDDLNKLDLGAISIQEFGKPTSLMIRIPEQKTGNGDDKAAIGKVRESIDKEFPDQKVEYSRSEFVGPQVGDELKRDGMIAFVLTIVAILGYVSYRFEWQYGVAAIITLVHDTLSVVGLFALMGLQFDLAALAAVLMVAGYSTNDTVIVFDRIRENRRKFKKMSMRDLINLSVNQTLARTIMTSVTHLLALVALWLFGGAVIRDFSISMIWGILVGTYSSIYVASSCLVYLPFPSDKNRETGE